jgi:hypothetical protein
MTTLRTQGQKLILSLFLRVLIFDSSCNTAPHSTTTPKYAITFHNTMHRDICVRQHTTEYSNGIYCVVFVWNA